MLKNLPHGLIVTILSYLEIDEDMSFDLFGTYEYTTSLSYNHKSFNFDDDEDDEDEDDEDEDDEDNVDLYLSVKEGEHIISSIEKDITKYKYLHSLRIQALGLSKLPKLPKNLKKLGFTNNKISNLNGIPSSLKILDCSGNYFIGVLDLSNLPDLEILDCSDNRITELTNIPKLIRLDCFLNHITHLDNLQQGIKYLYCNSNNIENLDHLPEGLEILHCSENKFDKLDRLPSTLSQLNCRNNRIKNLDLRDKKNLRHLDCGSNSINELNFLPDNLELLDCDKNEITKLDQLPKELRVLDCSSNDIKRLNNIPPKLISLNCSNNESLILNIPNSLIYVKCYDIKNFTNDSYACLEYLS